MVKWCMNILNNNNSSPSLYYSDVFCSQIQQFIQDLSDIWTEVKKKEVQNKSQTAVPKDWHVSY